MRRPDITQTIRKAMHQISVEDEMQISGPLYKIELETGIPINPFILSKKLWGKIATPFYENVMRERLAL